MSTAPTESEYELGEVVEEDFVKPRGPDNDDEMDITPMIDITFLLLIFFLVTSKMDEQAPVNLPKARHGNVVPDKDAIVIVMKRGSGEEAEVTKGDGGGFSQNIEQQNSELAEYIQQEFDAGKLKVVIRAEESVRQGEISRVSEAIGQSMPEGELINFATMEQN